MSIKAYMFLLFGALIILLSASQVFITHYFKNQLQTELAQTSKALSQDLVNVVIEQAGEMNEFSFELPQVDQHIEEVERISEQLEGVDDAIFSLEDEIEQLTQNLKDEDFNGYLAPLERKELAANNAALKAKVSALMAKEKRKVESQRRALIEAKKETARDYQYKLQKALKNIVISTDSWVDDGRVMIVKGSKSSPVSFERNIDIDSKGAKEQLDRFGNSMLLLIAISCVLALLFVYWLSHHVSQPLSQLSYGHKKLGAGQFGIQLKEKGVSEIKQILTGFNGMSRQLRNWSEKEQLMNQQQHLADLGQITRGIAHSLRNPLHTLGLLSDALAHETDVEQRQLMSQKVQQKISLMDKSIQSLLTLSSDAMDRTRPIPLNEIVQDILIELSIAGLKPEVSLNMSDNSIRVAGAEAELRSIIHAVMINAVEAQKQAPRIAIDITEVESSVCVAVTDWGEGISAEITDKLFEPHITTKAEGSGMGVYIAKRLLISHYGGDLSYRANPDGGTIALIRFSTETRSS